MASRIQAKALRFLEAAKAEGAEVLLFPEYLFGKTPFEEGVRALKEAAHALGVWAALGLANRLDMGSPSLAVRPDGWVVLRLEAEGVGVLELDRGFLEDYRAQYPILAHRRPAY